jgi:hypothetical protein
MIEFYFYKFINEQLEILHGPADYGLITHFVLNIITRQHQILKVSFKTPLFNILIYFYFRNL